MDVSACLSDDRLMPLAMGEEPPPADAEHVRGCGSCQRRVEQLRTEVNILQNTFRGLGATVVLPDREPPSALPQPPEPVPATIGRYRIIGRLDSGGQATVYRAAHPNLPMELVVKVSHRRASGAGPDRDRLVHEGKILAELDHPNLARVYDLDFDDDRPFLVMEYVRGRSLRQQTEEKRLPPAQAAGLMAKVARAMAAAHARGVLHLDLKPGNIVLDPAGEPRVIDFGIARLRGAWQEEAAEPGSISGTPEYMSPEQARGQPTDARSDVFSLGAVLYYLLVGRGPFAAETITEALERAASCRFDRQALRAAGVPRRLADICLRAMAARRGDRYASAADLAQALERFSGAGGGRGGMIFRLTSPFLTVELRWAVSIALVLGVGFWTMMLGPPFFLSAPREAAQSTAFDGKLEFDVRVWTAGAKDPVPLLEAVPLAPGAKVQIRGRVPRGSHVALFWLDCDGAPYDLSKDLVTVPVPSAAEVYYPGPDKSVALEGSAGTVVLLLCARRMGGEIMPEEISEVLAEGKAWPAMAEPATVVEFDSERVQVHRRDRGAPRPAGAAGAINDVPDTVRRRAEQLRLQLADRFEYVRGVAFTYRGQAE